MPINYHTEDRYYFGCDPDFYRQVHAAAGVENALYVDDLWQLYKRDPAYEREWQQVCAFYFNHGRDIEEHGHV